MGDDHRGCGTRAGSPDAGSVVKSTGWSAEPSLDRGPGTAEPSLDRGPWGASSVGAGLQPAEGNPRGESGRHRFR
jgi:hypothetical protein